MKHPNSETWMDYLYEENLPPSRRQSLRAHLEQCTECRTQLQAWQETQEQLNRWSLTPHHARPSAWQTWFPRAAAAAVLLATGLVLGRHLASPGPDRDSLRAELREEFEQALNHTLTQTQATLRQTYVEDMQAILAEYTRLQEQQRQQDLSVVATAIGDLEERHRRDNTAMRRDLETVAILTDAGFRQTQDQVVQLASLPLGNTRQDLDQP